MDAIGHREHGERLFGGASETTSYGMWETLSAPAWSPETYSAKPAYPRCNHYLPRRMASRLSAISSAPLIALSLAKALRKGIGGAG